MNLLLAFRCRLLIAAWVIGALGSATANAEDWPMFGRDQTRNAVSPEKDSPVDWDIGDFDRKTSQWTGGKARNVKWVAKLGSMTCGDPVVADGLVWVGTNNASFDSKNDASVLACFRESDGKLLYKYVSPRLAHATWQDWPTSSMACSPLVDGDRLWFATNRCEVVCLDIGPLKRGSGEARVVWKCDMMKDLGVYPNGAIMHFTRFSSVASYKDRIFIITANGVDQTSTRSLPGGHTYSVPAPEAPSLVCFKRDSGEVLWQDNSPGANILSGQWASPLVVEIEGRGQVIVPQGDGWVRSFDTLNGELIWQFDMNYKHSKWILGGRGTRNNILATPVSCGDRIYLAAGQQASHGEGPGRLCCIDPTMNGDISSQLAIDVDGNPIPHRCIQAVDPTTGETAIPNPNSGLVWEYSEVDQDGDGEIDFEEEFHRSVSSVAIKNGLLIAADLSGLVHCFDAGTGKRHWAYDTLANIYAPPLIVDEKFYVANDDGQVAIFRLSADPQKAMGELHPINAMLVGNEIKVNSVGSTAYTSPIFANGTLYIASRSHLFAIQAKSSQSPKVQQELGHWPQWRGPNRDNASTETGLLQEWPDGGPPLEWRVDGLPEGIASVSIADGKIYTVGYMDKSEYAIALDQRTGQLAWAQSIGPAIQENPLMRWLSQRSPTVDAGRVYVMRSDGDLVCLRTTDGAELWRKNYPRDFGSTNPYWGFCDYPMVDDLQLICSPGAPESGIVALNKFTGELVWKSKIPGIERPVYGTTVVAEVDGIRQYVTFSDQGIFGVAATDGKILWHYNQANDIRYGALHTPVVLGDRILVPNGYGRSIALLKLKGGPAAFQVQEKYHRKDLWLDPFQDNLVVVDNHAYAIPFRCGPVCVSLETGETIWGGERVQRSETIRLKTALTYADGRLVTRQSDGKMQLVEATPQDYHQRGTFRIPDHQPAIGATFPVIAGGRLYLRDNDRLFCYDIRRGVDESRRSQALSLTLQFRLDSNDRLPAPRRGPRSVFVPTPSDIVDEMLEMAKVDEKSVVYDLGSGDGRIVIAAAKKYRCRTVGREIDKELVSLSRERAAKAGVGDLVTIEHGDIFKVDLHQVDVIAVYLLPKQLEVLIPQFQQLKPGARIVSHQFEIPGIKPERTIELRSTEDGNAHKIHIWTTPLKASE